jgi:hypothetical protein
MIALFGKNYGLLLGIMLCAIVFQLESIKLYFGLFLNHFFPCTDCPGCSSPCYGNYDIYMMILALAVGIVLIGILIFKVIKFYKNRLYKN